ncbi:MAG: class I adenylate-forming enzyme family protein [Desulfosalsimonas sp.]|uniref:class I adenylate-forming enzyme family protein n=1 Tax=Desulfosalsimonas sp. TaxID=3073848 RepID=UPI0039708A28
MNLYALFKDAAGRYPEKPAIIDKDITVSYRELDDMICALAEDLRAFGVLPRQMIGLCFVNSPAYIAFTYALWKLDAAVVPIDADFKEAEVRQVCDRMQLSAIIHHQGGGDSWQTGRCPKVETPFYFRSIYSGARPESGIHMAFVRFTSGTTGSRKGVVLSHKRIYDRICAVNKVLRITQADRVLWTLPMSHHFVSTIVLYLACGAGIVLSGGIWSRAILESIRRNNVTLLYASPFHYSLLAADSSDQMMPGVRLAISTASGLPGCIHQRFYRRFQLPLAQAYGIIEIGLVCINTDRPAEKPGSVGPVLPDYQVQIKNPQAYPGVDGMTCGEVFFRGPGFFDAYFDPWIDDSAALVDGWFETGDIGGLDADGHLFLYGRKDHVINTAGMKVFPREVEAELNRHPEVKESCVYGRKNERLDQIVAARVVLHSRSAEVDSSALKAFCRRRLAAYKVPEDIDFTEYIEKTAGTKKIIRPQ